MAQRSDLGGWGSESGEGDALWPMPAFLPLESLSFGLYAWKEEMHSGPIRTLGKWKESRIWDDQFLPVLKWKGPRAGNPQRGLPAGWLVTAGLGCKACGMLGMRRLPSLSLGELDPKGGGLSA